VAPVREADRREARPARWLLPAGLGGVSVGLVMVLEQVPIAGWALLMDFGLAGFALGAALLALADRARGRSWPRAPLAAAGASAAFAVAHLLLAPPAPAAVVIVVDCLGSDRFTPALMPRTHAVTDSAWRFADARAQSSWTRSAVPSLLTGAYPVQHGIYRLQPEPDRLADGVETLAQVFDRAGWATAAFIDQAQLDPAFGLSAGYHRYNFRDGAAPALQAKFWRWHRFFRHVPRLAYLHYLDIHKPYLPDASYLPAELPPTSLSLDADTDWAGLMRAINSGDRPLTDGDWRYLEMLHEAEIRQLDDALGSLLERLLADGTLDNAWLVITSDHGEAFGEHDFFTHGGLPYEELLRIPLVIRPPGGLAAPAVIDAPIQHIDIAPTLLASLSLPPLSSASGRDFTAEMRGEADTSALASAPSFAEFFAHDAHTLGVREGSWKYLREGSRERLFDLSGDPGEHRDLAGERPEQLTHMRNLAAHFLATGRAGGSLSDVDWATAAARAQPWPEITAPGLAAQPEAESMEALRALGYIE